MPERLRIKDSIQSGRYEEALSVTIHSSRDEVNRAHIKMLSRFRAYPEIRELLNLAKSRIASETDIEKGRRLIRIGLKDEALACLIPALEEKGGSADDFLVVGQTLEQSWRFEAALPYFERAVELRGNAYDYLWLGTVLERLERVDDAMEQYYRAVEIRGSADDHRSLGGLLLKKQRFGEAEDHLLRAVELGDDLSSPKLLQILRAYKSKVRIKRLFARLAGLLTKSGKSERADEQASK